MEKTIEGLIQYGGRSVLNAYGVLKSVYQKYVIQKGRIPLEQLQDDGSKLVRRTSIDTGQNSGFISIKILLPLLTAVVMIYSIYSDFGPIRATLRKRAATETIQYDGGLWFAPNFFERLNDQSMTILHGIVSRGDANRPRRSDLTDQICPVILSAVPRLDPHWVWLTSSLLRHTLQDTESSRDVAPVTILSRPGAGLDHLRFPFRRRILSNLIGTGTILPLMVNHEKRMPPKSAFNYPLGEATQRQSEHFVLQLFDHAAAWENCHKRRCGYCLVFEDDVLMSTNWKSRINEAISLATSEDPKWGVLKLFEIDVRLLILSEWTVAAEDISILFAFALIGSFGLWGLIAYNPREKQMRNFRSLFWIFVWWFLILYMLGKNFFFPGTVLEMKNRFFQRTTLHDAIFPKRGAVANLYKFNDLPGLIAHTELVVRRSLNFSEFYFRKNLSTYGKEEFERIYQLKHSDRVRADVFVAEYFLQSNRSVKIIEPNVVQHIGFRSTEPSAEKVRIAMSSTFEDGNLF